MNFNTSDPLNALALDRVIRDSILNMGPPILTSCIGIAEMKVHSLYKDLGFTKMAQYIKGLTEEKRITKGKIYRWLYIGQEYLKYRETLEEIGFNNNHGPSKLLFLERALANREREDVLIKIKTLSCRDFSSYALGQSRDLNVPGPKKTNRKGLIIIKGKAAIRINPNLDNDSFNFLKRINRIAGKAIKDGEKVYYIRVKNIEEFERYERAFNKLIRRLRKKSPEPKLNTY